MMIDEAQASLKGYRTVKETGSYTPEELGKMRHNLWKAYGSYAVAPAALSAPFIASALLFKGRIRR
jgi:hypothetical protein